MAETLMIVEPEILARTILAAYLRECGYHVIEGVGVDDIWKVLSSGTKLDIVLTNMQLAGGDGFTLAQQLRELHPDIDVILALGVAKAVAKAGELCEEGPVGKPYHPDEVLRRIHLLRGRRKVTRDREP